MASPGNKPRNSKDFQLRKFEEGLPTRFRGISLELLNRGSSKPLYDVMVEYLDNYEVGKGLYLCSPNSGNGKTHAAIAVAKELIIRGKTRFNSYFYSSDDLMEKIRATTMRGESLAEQDFYKNIVNSDIIIIDDIGVEKLTKFVAGRYYYLINNLWGNKKTVFFTSKFTIKELLLRREPDVEAEVVTSILSRIDQLVHSFKIKDTSDYRR